MKVLIATGLYPPEIGGPATYAKELFEGLPPRGVGVSLLKFSDVRHLPKFIRHYVYYRRTLKALKSSDVVLALDPVSVGLPAMKAAKKLNKPFVVKIVGDYAWEQGVQRFGVTQQLDEFVKTRQTNFFVRRLQNIQTRVAEAADRVLVPSPYLKDIVVQWGISADNITIINNAISIPNTLPTFEKKSQFLIVSAGRRVPWKGFEALEKLRGTHPDWHIEIISGQPREIVLGWIKTSDVFVLNSSYEGFPHTLVEAMTLGIPVVAKKTRANQFIVEDAGLLVEDDIALEQALLEIQKDPKKARDRAQAGKERMKSFDLSYMLDRTAEWLKSI